jgi:hypothetical protein
VAKQWVDGATRVLGRSSGPAAKGAGAKILHHTTEGASASGAVSAYRATGSWPTITAEWTGTRLKVFQHMGFDQMARALEHPSGPETNRANVVQIEHVGFTDDAFRKKVGADPSLHVSRWPATRWAAIARLCREIEAATGCHPIARPDASEWAHPTRRLGGQEFFVANCHTAHVFAPGNHHTDGTGFRIDLVLGTADDVHRNLKAGADGADVLALQLATRLRALRCGRPDHAPAADGVMGAESIRDAAFVAFILGIGDSQAEIAKGGISESVQTWIRDPSKRNRVQMKRAVARRKANCKKVAS